MVKRRKQSGAAAKAETKLAKEVEEIVEDALEHRGKRRRNRRGDADEDGGATRDGRQDGQDGETGGSADGDPSRLTAGGRRKLGNLGEYAGDQARDAIRKRGGGAAQVSMLDPRYQEMTVAEIANRAAKGDAAAETAMKIIKQASSKAAKYGRGGH
ncbi:hypothetical protein [Actinoplanes sp. NPDC051851]|uniref:hypothetical protein n=1 Tax=Actinoplanes sp. NPDC051851 TaxID=3154753 RepID=UPI0034492CED